MSPTFSLRVSVLALSCWCWHFHTWQRGCQTHSRRPEVSSRVDSEADDKKGKGRKKHGSGFFWKPMASLEPTPRAGDRLTDYKTRGEQVRFENRWGGGWRERRDDGEVIQSGAATRYGNDITHKKKTKKNSHVNTILHLLARCSSSCTSISAVHRPGCYYA